MFQSLEVHFLLFGYLSVICCSRCEVRDETSATISLKAGSYYGKDKKHEAIAADFINLGSVAKKTGDYQDALNLANKALEMRNDLEVVDKRKIAETIWFQGLVFENKKNYSTAYEKLAAAQEAAQEAPNNEEILPKIQKDLERLKRATPIKNNYMLDL